MRSLANINPRLGNIQSCGLSDFAPFQEIDPPDPRTIDVLQKHGIFGFQHNARGFTDADLNKFDYVFGITASIVKDIRAREKKLHDEGHTTRAKVMPFGAYNGKKEAEDVKTRKQRGDALVPDG